MKTVKVVSETEGKETTLGFPDEMSEDQIKEAIDKDPFPVKGVDDRSIGDIIRDLSNESKQTTNDTTTSTVSPAETTPSTTKEVPQPVLPEAKQIESDEGSQFNKEGKHISYMDSLAKPTGGIGHLLSPEEIKKYPVGTSIPDEVVKEWFNKDVEDAKKDTEAYLGGIDVPDEVRNIITNMAFNLGRTKLNKFKDLKAALHKGDFKEAAKEMQDSDWYKQVKGRASRLVSRMESITTDQQRVLSQSQGQDSSPTT